MALIHRHRLPLVVSPDSKTMDSSKGRCQLTFSGTNNGMEQALRYTSLKNESLRRLLVVRLLVVHGTTGRNGKAEAPASEARPRQARVGTQE